MKFFTIEREAFLIWRFIQFWIFLCIFILETIQLFGYSKYYLNQPANEQLRVWVIEGISFAIIAYILAKFNHRWNTGPVKDDILLDWSLLIIWTVQCFLNMVPAIFGKGLDCNIETSPYNITTHEGETRCRLFIGSTALSFVALSSTFVTLMLTIIRWKNKQLVPSSIKSYNTRSQKSFLIQEGSLDNGEPVLFFYSRNRPLGSSIHGKIIRNPIVKTARTSISSPINITISEPEMAAAAALKYDDVPNVTVHDDGKNENEKDNSVLRY